MNDSIESKSNEITVLFMSGIHVSGRGFLASYSVIDKQGNFRFKSWLPHFTVSKSTIAVFFWVPVIWDWNRRGRPNS